MEERSRSPLSEIDSGALQAGHRTSMNRPLKRLLLMISSQHPRISASPQRDPGHQGARSLTSPRPRTYTGLGKALGQVRREMNALTIIKLSGKGQLVIPSEIRNKYHLRKGDRFLVREEACEIVLQPLERHPLLDLRGAYRGGTSLTQALVRERQTDKAKEDDKRV